VTRTIRACISTSHKMAVVRARASCTAGLFGDGQANVWGIGSETRRTAETERSRSVSVTAGAALLLWSLDTFVLSVMCSNSSCARLANPCSHSTAKRAAGPQQSACSSTK